MPLTPPVAPGDRLELTFGAVATGGEGLARHQGYALFAPFVGPGDRARVEVTAAGPRFGRAVLVEVLEPGPHRARPGCPYFGDCGGCQLQHLSYPAQLEAKRGFVADSLSRLASLKVEVAPAVPSHPHWNYRTTTQYAALMQDGGIGFGFRRYHSHDVLPIEDCPITQAASNNVMRVVRGLLRGEHRDLAGPMGGLTVRHSPATGQTLALLHLQGPPQAAAGLARDLAREVPTVAGVLAGPPAGPGRSPHLELLAGHGFLEQRLGPYHYRVSATSFFQVNPAVAARLAALVTELVAVQPGESVIDAYAGVGTLSVPLAGVARELLVVEAERTAIADARRNLRELPAETALLPGTAEKRLGALARAGVRAGVVVLDPPRRGCPEAVLRAAAALAPRAVVLVSCDPAAFARDLGVLARLGYPPAAATPLDMFPQTAHVEAVALCRRR